MIDTYVDERDYELLEADRYTFFVLKRIMGGECKLLLSDHERLILCFTGHHTPRVSQKTLCGKPCLSGYDESEGSRICTDALYRC